MRNYSPKTLNTYTHWTRRFQLFTRSKPPEVLDTEDVKAKKAIPRLHHKTRKSRHQCPLSSPWFQIGPTPMCMSTEPRRCCCHRVPRSEAIRPKHILCIQWEFETMHRCNRSRLRAKMRRPL
ncbi:MAG: hypothetical protein PHG55_09120 [Verrucomicrobiota bacterium]|nr:hypothetical protein [Verrucomicrobiota bacterium]